VRNTDSGRDAVSVSAAEPDHRARVLEHPQVTVMKEERKNTMAHRTDEVDPHFQRLVAQRWAEGYLPILVVFANECREVISTVADGVDLESLLEYLLTVPTEPVGDDLVEQ
jgi:hypothetical protein